MHDNARLRLRCKRPSDCRITAAVVKNGVGGLNSVVGAMIGTGIIGGTTTIFSNFMSQAFAQIAVFAVAIAIIRLFPNGLSKRNH
jgi:branched-subunit amino acid ABC-type transport system permease component